MHFIIQQLVACKHLGIPTLSSTLRSSPRRPPWIHQDGRALPNRFKSEFPHIRLRPHRKQPATPLYPRSATRPRNLQISLYTERVQQGFGSPAKCGESREFLSDSSEHAGRRCTRSGQLTGARGPMFLVFEAENSVSLLCHKLPMMVSTFQEQVDR